MTTEEMTTEEMTALANRWADQCKWCRAAGNPPECVDTLERSTKPLDDQERERLFARVRIEMDRAASEHACETVEETVAVAVIELLGSDDPWVGHLIDAVEESR